MSISTTTAIQSLFLINNGQLKSDDLILSMFREDDSLLFDLLRDNSESQIYTAVTKAINIPGMQTEALFALSDGLRSSLLSLVEDVDFIDSHTDGEYMDDYSNDVEDIIAKLENLNNILITIYA